MIEVTEEKDGSFTIEWDDQDPAESILNTWSEQDFIDVIQERLHQLENKNNNSVPVA